MSDSSLVHAIAGAGAGCASLAITYPLYARMVRQQVQQKGKQTATLQSTESTEDYSPLQSIVLALKRACSKESIEENFSGLQAALFAVTVQSGIYYLFFQLFKNIHEVTTSPLGNLFVASEAGIATVMLTNPLWVINSRQITHQQASSNREQQQTLATVVPDDGNKFTPLTTSTSSPTPSSSSSSPSSPNANFFRAFYHLLSTEGISGYCSGIGPALALVSSPALQFASYEYLKALLIRLRITGGASGNLSHFDFFMLGAISKIIATVITYPIQTLKSQLQKTNSPYTNEGWLKGLFHCVRDMAASKEGIFSFYRGLNAKILQTSLTAAFLFVFRERLIHILSRWSQATPKLFVK